MQTFISETLKSILNKQSSFENTVFILPSQRAGVFLKEEFKKLLPVGFLPNIINSEEFIEEITEIKKIDNVQLLFHFYSVYKNIEENSEEFESFFSWAITVLQDFNDIDQHLVNPKDIFTYLKDIERLKNWSVKKPLVQTQMMKNHFSFMEKLGEYYTAFYAYLREKNIGYQGLIYRESTKDIEEYIQKNKHKKYYFIGFNALNKAEEYLFQQMLNNGNTEIYWDIDTAFLESKHQAGTFIRKYKSDWKYYLTHELQTSSSNFGSEKSIEIIGASKNVTQIKYAGELLKKLPNFNKTAYVLADESLLPITLNSLPKEVQAINITMGYPLKDVPTTSLFIAVFNLFINQEKLQRATQEQFYFKDVLQFFKQPNIHSLFLVDGVNIFDEISLKIAQDNQAFISLSQLESFLAPLDVQSKKCILTVFKKFENSLEFIERIINLIVLLKEQANPLEKEYLFRFYTAFSQLQNLQIEYSYLKTLKTIHQLFNQLIQSESISFKGEPLQGLQLMGMLETRVLDFENVIITSVNENVLPKGGGQNSFIPFDVKLEFNLPTYREKDAIFSYHFFRLLQRAKNIFLLYNSENDSFGGGEKSRFISQLMHLKPNLKEVQIAPNVTTEKSSLMEISKTKEILEKLKEQAVKGFSPSTLTNYLYNPIDFYKQKILGLREYKEVEETVAANTMGTIIHDTLDVLYQPFIGKFITKESIKEMLNKVEDLVLYYFKKHFHSSDVYTGKNRLIFEISKDYINRFLAIEIDSLQEDDVLKIIATEQDLEATITIDEFDFPIKLRGQVDRIDQLNGVTRIIDYKTGNVTAANLKVSDISVIGEEKYSKAIQVLLYAFLYSQNFETKELEGGIISFKNLKGGFLKVDFGKKDHEISSEKIDEFLISIKNLIKEIFNPEIPFTEKLH
jgi:ATP-dependent helicase/nuclease subunit B